jgi:ribonuclease P protein component
MLPKENRLKKKKEFEAVFKGGRHIKSQNFFIKYLANGTEQTRIGFVVSKKVSKKAVDRNKAKRRMREAFKNIDGKLKNGISIIIVAYPGLKGVKFKEVLAEIESALKKGELIK